MSENYQWTLLTEVADDTEAELLLGLLKSAEIPAKSEESSPYTGAMRVIGGLAYEIRILVPEDYLSRARELMDTLPPGEE